MTQPTGRSGSGSVTAAISSAGPTASGDVIPVEIIALEGEFDLANVRQLEHAIEQGIDAGARDFIADLSEVEFLDGRSVHALLDGWKRAARRNGRFVLVDPPARIRRVLILIGVSRTFATFASRKEALAYFASGHA
jgi:anti-sigma B factor antagonist